MKSNSLLIKVLFIFFFALLLRLYLIDSMPLGVRNDEASFGFNAYSILQTGKDEHGQRYPLVFKAFGDQKLPGYMYALVPSIKIFGLNNFAIRLPSVIAGSLAAVMIFLLLSKSIYLRKYRFLGALLFAASPWSIILSRSAFESNLALLFFICGLNFYVFHTQSHKLKHAVFSGIFFGLTWYTYIPYRLITIVMLISIAALTKIQNIRASLKPFTYICVTLLLVALPLLPSLFSQSGTARFNQVSIFSDDGPTMEIIEARTFCTEHFPKILCYADSNKIVVYGRNMLNSFIQSLSPEYLFITGDSNTGYLDAEHFGNIHMYLLPFYFLGIMYLGRKLLNRKLDSFDVLVIVGTLVSTLPAVLTHGPQMVRMSSLLPFLIILCTYGIAYSTELFDFGKKKSFYLRVHSLVAVIFGLIFLFNYVGISIPKNDVLYYSHIHKLMSYLRTVPEDTRVYVHKIPEAVTFYAYVNAISPSEYHNVVTYPPVDIRGFSHANSYKNIRYSDKNYDELMCTLPSRKALFVAHEEIDPSVKPVMTITSSNKVHTMYYIYRLSTLPEPNCAEFRK